MSKDSKFILEVSGLGGIEEMNKRIISEKRPSIQTVRYDQQFLGAIKFDFSPNDSRDNSTIDESSLIIDLSKVAGELPTLSPLAPLHSSTPIQPKQSFQPSPHQVDAESLLLSENQTELGTKQKLEKNLIYSSASSDSPTSSSCSSSKEPVQFDPLNASQVAQLYAISQKQIEIMKLNQMAIMSSQEKIQKELRIRNTLLATELDIEKNERVKLNKKLEDLTSMISNQNQTPQDLKSLMITMEKQLENAKFNNDLMVELIANHESSENYLKQQILSLQEQITELKDHQEKTSWATGHNSSNLKLIMKDIQNYSDELKDFKEDFKEDILDIKAIMTYSSEPIELTSNLSHVQHQEVIKAGNRVMSYAEKVQTKAKPKQKIILIRPKRDQTPQDLRSKIQEDNSLNNCAISSVKTTRDSVQVVCQDTKAKNEVISKLKPLQENNTVDIIEKRPPITPLIYFNVPKNTSSETFFRNSGISKLVQWDDFENPFIKEGKNKNVDVWHVKLPSWAAEIQINQKYFFIGLNRVGCHKRAIVIRCKNCLLLEDHLENQCKKPPTCPHCAREHTIDQCPRDRAVCVNCWLYNQTNAKNIDFKHSTLDRNCPTFHHYRNFAVKKANYQ